MGGELTGSAARLRHGRDLSPAVVLGVVALGGGDAARAVEAAHGVQQPVDHGHAHAQPRARHRRHLRPRVLLRVVTATHKHSHKHLTTQKKFTDERRLIYYFGVKIGHESM